MLVDMHAHVIPGRLDAVGEGGRGPHIGPCDDDAHARLLENDRGMKFKARDAFYSAERRLEEMEASGVDAEVVSPMPPLLDYSLAAAEGLELSRRVNAFIAELTRTDRDRLLGMGMLPMQAPDLAVAELTAVRDQGLVAVEIASNVLGRSLHEPEFAEFWAEVERLAMPVFVHGMPGDLGGRVPAGLVAVAGFAVGADCALAATSIIAGGVAERHPRLRLAFSHGAGGLPCMLPRANFFWGKTWNEEPSETGEGTSPAELAKRFYYDGLVMDRRTLCHLIDMMGHTQVLVGSDFPAMERERPCGRTLRSLDLAPDVLEDITWHNTFRFLGIDTPQLAAAGAAPSSEGVTQ
ncbi:MAG TPA: amidohydrolase family protein [Solirubrobacteraceae bacterium]|jgi:aminocarboxymuconate-semialdehyde decarboxylase|nr:amidohydrolase family protein [Solirubrobacteraceae bacterium]